VSGRVGGSRRARLTVAATIAVLAAIGIGVLAAQLLSTDDHASRLPLDFRQRAAVAPFQGYGETSVEVDGRCRRVAVADTAARRADGLRGHVDLGPYAGMLFVFDGDTNAAFTMAGVTAPLEIGWYAADGARVDRAHMTACPDRGQSECPIYAADRKYRIAFERPGGSSAPSQLAPCG
jgi:uncharacterized membrane protein (UPF0127 family)